jgi:hypothetical protein
MPARPGSRPSFRPSQRWLRPLALWLTTLPFTLPAGASAQQVAVATAPAPEPDPPSVFVTGYQGLLAGAAVGLAGGYLYARKDDFQKRDWQKLGLGLGIGALAGAGLGISLGVADRAGTNGARYVARDLSLGVVFGAVVGTIGGGISAIVQDDAEHVGYGASIGVIAGAGLGIVTGIIEGQAKRRRQTATSTAVRITVRPTLAIAAGDPSEMRTRTLLPGLSGSF